MWIVAELVRQIRSLVAVVCLTVIPATALADTVRVSVGPGGVQATGGSSEPKLSADGRFVAFISDATNLVSSDTNGALDIFVHDRQTGETTRVSVGTGGVQANGLSVSPSISADGRFVAFMSQASNLVPNDTNGTQDIFVHDRQTGVTTRVSVRSGGFEANGPSDFPYLSSDGRFVAFQSGATNLVPDDTIINGFQDIFVHDRQTGETTLVSRSIFGAPANGDSASPSLSADGRFVMFFSRASDLVPTDTNGVQDVFVHDRQTGTTTRVSVGAGGAEANGRSEGVAALSADGRFVAFRSLATNLAPATGIFAHNRQTGETQPVSVGAGQALANNLSFDPNLSANGAVVAFASLATNLVPGDTNGFRDIFVAPLPFAAALTVTISGSEPGMVTSSPAGIVCPSDCFQLFPVGTVVTLTATPASGTTFDGFGGDPDCADGSVTLLADTTCAAGFTGRLTVSPASGSFGLGQGFDLVNRRGRPSPVAAPAWTAKTSPRP